MIQLKKLIFASSVILIGVCAFAEVSPQPSETPEPQQQEFSDEIQRTFDLRSLGHIQLTNIRGNITVEGWSQDIILVKAKRRVFAPDADAAKKELSAMDLRFTNSGGKIECSAEYGHGLDIEQRLAERDRPEGLQSKMDMMVYAPSRLKLKVWTDTGLLSLKNWGASAELRTISGDISAENFKGDRISSLCQNCSVHFRAIKGSIRSISDGGDISVDGADSHEIFLDTDGGNITLQNTSGNQLCVTKTGDLSAREIRGHFEFQTNQGAVDISGLRGFASGKTESGSIHLLADEWSFDDKALIESASGSISLSLPKNFAAEVDLRSLHGTVQSAFPVLRASDQHPERGHLVGRVGEQATDLFRVFSGSGNIEILRLTH